MIRFRAMIFVGLPALALVACCWQALALQSAHRRHADARSVSQAVMQELAELDRLEASSEEIAWGARPETDVLALARAAVSNAGLSSQSLQGVSPTGDRPVPGQPSGGVQIREQSVRIALQAMTAVSLGSFLRAWLEVAPRWTVTSIEMTHANSRGSAGGLYSVALMVTAPYAQGTQP